MVKVDKYIRQLLFEHDCVIIPEFGGLLTHKTGVYYDEENSRFLPASKRLAFNEILRIDDGLLSFWIASQENVSREEATRVVHRYVEQLRAELLENKELTIDRIGSFSNNKEGKLVFEPDYTQNFDAAWYGFEAVPAQLLKETAPVDRTENHKLTSIIAPLHPEVVRTPTTRKRTHFGWVAAATIAGAIFTLSMIYRPIDGTMLSSLNPVSSLENFFIRTPDDDNQPVKPFAYAEPVPVNVWNDLPPLDSVGTPASVIQAEVAVETPEPQVTKVEQAPVATAKKHYHLIAGSFSTNKNVNGLMSRLHRVGFPNSSVVKQGKGRWVMVAAGSYESEREAYNHKNELDNAIGVESWVLKK